jgi:hypothetical protein
MFRALEGILGKPTGTVNNGNLSQNLNRDTFPTTQSDLYTKVLPNMVPGVFNANGVNGDMTAFLTVDPNGDTRTSQVLNARRNALLNNFTQPIQIPQSVLDANTGCANASLSALQNTVDFSQTSRCGWIYDKNTVPAGGKGALGTKNGAVTFVDQPKGKWYWDLNEAQKQIDKDLCDSVTRCTDIDTSQYSGKCAWNTVTGKAIPVDSRGLPKYDTSVSKSILATSSSGCPPPPAPGTPAAQLQAQGEVCAVVNGTITRDCVVKQLGAAGCSDKGALYLALESGAVPNNYLASAMNLPSYIKYQALSQTPLLQNTIKTGSISVNNALTNFQYLKGQAEASTKDALNYAARDLCLKQGDFDKFDFCSDYTNTTVGPYDLGCLQKQWRRQGGLPAGVLYPSASNKAANWDSKPNWGAVLTYIADLASKCTSKDATIQSNTLKDFMGITRQSNPTIQISKIQGVEVFWFEAAGGFIGRRIHVTANDSGDLIPNISSRVNIGNTGVAVNVAFAFITNVRPPSDMSVNFSFTTDDGAIIVVNKGFPPGYDGGKHVTTNNQLSAMWPQPPTKYTSQCWPLTANGPNYILGLWNQNGGHANYDLRYSPCAAGQSIKVPDSWCSLTQEPNAPMLSFEVQPNSIGPPIWREYRQPMQFTMGPSGSARPVADGIRLGSSGAAIMNLRMRMNAWRSITIALTIPEAFTAAPWGANTVRTVFKHGPLQLIIYNNGSGWQFILEYNGFLIRLGGDYSSVVGKKYLVVINQRSDFQDRLPNRLTGASGYLSDWQAGGVINPNGGAVSGGYKWGTVANGINSNTDTPIGTGALFGATSAENPTLGDSGLTRSPDVTINWIHFFDHELSGDEVQKDAQGKWVRSFMPL